jgi:intraflagellar transport protein 122
VFNIARYLINSLPNTTGVALGVSKLYILFALAKHAKDLGAYKLARFAYDKLQQLRLPNNWIDQIDLSTITIRAKPFSDKEDLLPICHRCSATNPLVANKGNTCVNCKHSFIYSFYSFDVLPLVQFFPEDDITDEEALRLIEREPPVGGAAGSWKVLDSQKSTIYNRVGATK